METAQGAVLIVLGVIICLAGYSLFRSMLPLWGFLLVGFIAMTFVPLLIKVPANQHLLVQIVVFIVGGIMGALAAKPLYYVTVFLSGAILGGLVGLVFGAYMEVSSGAISLRALNELAAMPFPPEVNSTMQVALIAILALATGAFAIGFQKFMITASTAFLGSAALVSGLTGVGLALVRFSSNRAVWVVVSWLIIGMLGMFIQYRTQDET